MRGAGGMDDKRLGIAHVCQVGEQFDVANQLLTSFQAALDAKAKNRAIAMRMILRGYLVLWVARQPGIAYPTHGLVPFQEFGNALGILAVPFHTQGQRL